MRVLSLFSGIGAFEKALDNIGVKYELVNYCEIDKYASKSYAAIHGVSEDMNLWDVTKVDGTKLAKDIDLITYGFPCQDISLAGKQKGLFNEDNTLTRSGLFFEALRIIEETKPRVAIAENVKNLTSKKFKEQFKIVLDSLAEAGYANYYAVLNLKDFGIPQNRERVFIVSIRKDADYPFFHFPEGFPLELRLRDILEEEVDEKYYLSDQIIESMRTTSFQQYKLENRVTNEDGVVGTLLARDYKDPKCVQLGQMYPNSGNPQAGRIYDADGISPTMDTCSGGNRMPKIAEPMAYDEQNQYIRKDGCVGTLTTDGSSPKKNNRVVQSDLRIRKLTPKECFRLMGFDDADLDKAKWYSKEESAELLKRFPKHKGKRKFTDEERIERMSDSQLYRQAGNSIGIPVLEHIFKALLECGVLQQ